MEKLEGREGGRQEGKIIKWSINNQFFIIADVDAVYSQLYTFH